MGACRVGLGEVNRAGIGTDGEGRQWLCFEGREKNLELLSAAPGTRTCSAWNCLLLPVNRVNMLLMETVAGIEEATDDYLRVRGELLKVNQGLASHYPIPPAGEPPPFQHQVDAFCQAYEWFQGGGKGFGQLSEMGIGKSRWAIDLMRAMAHSSLLIVQNSTSLQWLANLERGWPGVEVVMLTGMPIPKRKALLQNQRRKTPWVAVVNWEALGKLREPLCKVGFDLVVADEATRMKDRTTTMSKAAYQVAQSCKYRVAMTGSPFGNAPTDVWGIFRFIDPTIYGKSYWPFAEKYFRLGGFTGKEFVAFQPERLPEFIEKLYSCSYRITKASVTDMPEKCFETIKVEMGEKQRALYDQVEKDLYATLKEEGKVKTLTVANALSCVTRLQQITAGFFPSNNGDPDCTPIPSAKTEWVTNYVSDLLRDTDAKVAVWCRFTKEIERIGEELTKNGLSFGVIAGNVKNPDRESLRVAFNDRSNPLRVLIIQLQAGAYGLDIPSLDVSIYHSSSFSHLERVQSEDRGHRMGRVRPYQIIDVACKKTVDIEILAALREKAGLAEMLLMKGFLGIPVGAKDLASELLVS